MRLSDLVDQTELRLTMLTGGQSLDRPVRQVYTTDLLDPGRYLSGGELVLTGLMWRRRPADSERFAAEILALGAKEDDIAAQFHGGFYCPIEFAGDASQID